MRRIKSEKREVKLPIPRAILPPNKVEKDLKKQSNKNKCRTPFMENE